MTQRTHNRTALLVAVLQLALSFGLGLNLVVCRSTDGHVAVESVLADCCASHPLREPGRSLSPSSDCDGCVDTPLVQTALQRDPGPPRGLLPPPESLSVGSPFPTLPLAPSTVAVKPAHGAPAATALSTRRSVVLLV
jgi:hypothetical protein